MAVSAPQSLDTAIAGSHPEPGFSFGCPVKLWTSLQRAAGGRVMAHVHAQLCTLRMQAFAFHVTQIAKCDLLLSSYQLL